MHIVNLIAKLISNDLHSTRGSVESLVWPANLQLQDAVFLACCELGVPYDYTASYTSDGEAYTLTLCA